MTGVLVIGAAGMVGAKLTYQLVADGAIAGRRIDELVLVDVVAPAAPASAPFKVMARAVDLAAAGSAEAVVAARPDFIFHLAAIVSGEAETDFDKGYRVNLDGTRFLFEAIRKVGGGYRPRVIFTSSIAVFGAPFPAVVDDEFLETPLTSYGTQKAIGELLLSDYTRRGFMDGIGIRLPTICVRPGKPNKGGVGVLLRHHPRAARRPGGLAAGAGKRAPLVRIATRGHRLPHPRGGARRRQPRRPPQPQHAGRLGHGRRGDSRAPQGRR